MYLKALEIQGFKSFPDKTVLNFGEDITDIVGPNGSGKSNISDAIRWVMGEQSAKGLRGAKMEDVIFGGTAKRPPQGFAQVTLVIDNTEHIFPTMEESEVAVTRRYYRSGDSEYYINRQAVRLKDVTELFLDTGMGREGYSIIGQGRIDEILSARSGERREIFEEAAGISKYRYRKEESERKLSRTQENLVRINDKIAELELQVEPLRDQAEKAKKYLTLRDELRLLEISVWLENLDALKAGQRKLETDFHAAEAARDEARTALESLYAAGERFSHLMQEKDVEAEQVRARMTQQDARAAEREANMAALRSTAAHNQESIRQAELELKEQEGRAGNLREQITRQEGRVAELDTLIQTEEAALEAALSQARAAAEQAAGAQGEAESLRGREALAAAAAADARAALSAAAAESRELLERQTAVDGELETHRAQLKQAQADSKANRRALEDAKENVEAAANMIQGHTLRMQERERRAAAAAERRTQLTLESGALDDRLRLLSEMEKEYEGFPRAVRSVMQNRKALRGIHGPVASLMAVEQRYAVAIEIALGAGLQNIVVDREEDAKAAIGFLKRHDAGRATFLPLSAIRGDMLRENGVDREPGYVGVASRLVDYDEQYRDIFQSLLGRTVVAEDLDRGVAMARKYGHRFRIVTLDGQVINRGGSMTGGSVSRSTGILSRAAELKTLRSRTEELHVALEAAGQEEEELTRELEKARYELNTAQEQRRQAEDEALRLESGGEHFRLLKESLSRTLENLEGERAVLEDRLTENREKARAAEEEISRQESLAEGLRLEIQEKLSGQTELLARSGELTEAVSGQKSRLAALNAERETTAGGLENLRRLCREMAGDQTAKEARLAEYQQNIVRAEEEIAGCQAETEAIRAAQAALREELERLNREKIDLEAKRTAQNRAGQEQNETLLNMERAVSLLEQKLSAAAMEEKQILDRLWEHYELSHSDAQAQRMELESVPKASRRIAELKREISALGTPNIGAIEEFDRVNGRYTYLSGQRDDVEKAKGEIESVIGELTQEMTRIFDEQFKLIAASFQETFLELFGGGQATLELEDPEDILGCGIEIRAQPPGKTLKTISLLSGGEKAFVAIALYFAILKVHPTPFCIMDEIEAALDDANVTRYARYMRRLAGKTQFIVITHRRGTMEEADVLYGVTMQEQGVSKILTINLNDMAEELEIE